MNLKKMLLGLFLLTLILALAQGHAYAQSSAKAGGGPGLTMVPPVSNPCTPRFNEGDVIKNPPALYSQNGVLNVRFTYQETTDSNGRLLHCFMTDSGIQQPTLHVNPGDRLIITVTNNTPMLPFGEPFNPPNCGDNQVEFTPPASGITSVGSSMNIHYHGTNVTPQCGGDNVTKTLINSFSTFQYNFVFPDNEPPGLYWYHPHVHGLAERDLLGGATGALVVDGIQDVQPAVQGLKHRILVIRDQQQINGLTESAGNCGNGVPFQDLSVNYVPIDSFVQSDGSVAFTPATLQMEEGETQFWRIVNSSADTILDLQVVYDGVPQVMQIVGIDAVPVNSQTGPQPPSLVNVTRFRLPTAGRVEFLIQAPDPSVKAAQLITNNINTGRDGDCDPMRTIFNIQLTDPNNHSNREVDEPGSDLRPVQFTRLNTHQQRFGGLKSHPVSANRVFQFSENQPTMFFITEVGQPRMVFDNNNPPAVVTTQGSVEKWTIQNVAHENHEFHMHQIHFLVLKQDNFKINGTDPAPGIDKQYLDMIEVPFWDDAKNPDPSLAPAVELLMDFRGMDIGDFVYHCHILSHEDLGMMAIIRVNPKRH